MLDSHERGARVFSDRLQRVAVQCTRCGFEDGILRSEWRTRLETDPRSGHARYLLTCPDCANVETVDLNI